MEQLIALLPLVLPWAYLGLSIAAVAATINALFPIRRNKLLLLPSFLAGTVVAELAGYGIVGLVATSAAFVGLGGLDAAVGRVAVGIALAAGLGLSVLLARGLGAAGQVQRALRPLLGGTRRRPTQRWRLLVPFPLRGATARVTRNVEYASVAGQRLRLDVYHPRGDGVRPAVIHVHGGGWTVGDKREQGVPLMSVLADRGFIGFNVNYRLSPGATWPEHLIDVKRAIAWVRANAEHYGVDPRFLAIAGGSAGGHLATMAALTAGDPALQPGFEDADTSVDAVASLYAIYDLTSASGRHPPGFSDRLLEPLVIKAFEDEAPERFVAASPLHRIRAECPPMFVIHGDRDTLAPLQDARDFVAALRRVSQSDVVFAEIRGAHHSFDFFVSVRSLPILEGVGDFFEHVAAAAPPVTGR